MSYISVGGGGGGGTSPGGANTDIQYNNAGSFGGDSGFTYAGGGGALAYAGSGFTLNLGGDNKLVLGGLLLGAGFDFNVISFNDNIANYLGIAGGGSAVPDTLFLQTPSGGNFSFNVGTDTVLNLSDSGFMFQSGGNYLLNITTTTFEYDLPGVARLLDYGVTTANTWTFSSSKDVAITGSLLIQNIEPMGVSGSLPGVYTRLTTDTAGDNRIGVALDASDNPYLGFGPGGSAAQDIFLNRQGMGVFGIGSTTTNTGGSLILTDITTNDAAALIKTGTTLNNGAGLSTGTLLTAPSAGNPTKWIPVVDNGTTRYIPAW